MSINDQHLKSLQDFQDKFRLAKSTPKAIIEWYIGLRPMKWRIVYKTLSSFRKFWEGPNQYMQKGNCGGIFE